MSYEYEILVGKTWRKETSWKTSTWVENNIRMDLREKEWGVNYAYAVQDRNESPLRPVKDYSPLILYVIANGFN
jgi:hypothetical protein